MLYVISGSSRAGKTLIATELLKKRGLTYLSLDWLVMGFTNGMPEYGIHDKLMPDEIARRSWSFLRAMMESMIHVEADCVIEGEALLPELIAELKEKYPDKLRICFIGFTDVDPKMKFKDIKKYSLEQNDWLSDKSDEYILDHVQNMIGHSKKIAKACKQNDLEYFDTSKDFMGTLQKAIAFLLA